MRIVLSRSVRRPACLARGFARAVPLLVLLAGATPALSGPADGWLATRPPEAATTAATPDNPAPAALTVMAGAPGETALDLSIDLATAFAGRDMPIIRTIVGDQGAGNVAALFSVPAADLAIVQSDILDHLASNVVMGGALSARVGILAKLHDAELHIVAGRSVTTISELAGKTVNLIDANSGAALTAQRALAAHGVDINPTHMPTDVALAKVASGEIAATVLVTGKPARALSGAKLPAGLKLLPVPYVEGLQSAYVPTTITNEDYPELVPTGQRVETIAVGVVMAGSIAPQPQAQATTVNTFTETFLAKLRDLRQGVLHPKWRETHAGTELPGWKRLPDATAWLQSHLGSNARNEAAVASAAPEATAPSMTPVAAASATMEVTRDRPADPSSSSDAAQQVEADPIAALAEATRAAHGNPAEQERVFRAFLAQAAAGKTARAALLE